MISPLRLSFVNTNGVDFMDGIEAWDIEHTWWLVYSIGGSLIIQYLFLVFGIFRFIYITYQRSRALATGNASQQTPVTMLFFIERWDNHNIGERVRSIAKTAASQGELIALISSEYVLESKMLFSTLEKEYGSRFKVCVLHEKTRGLDLSQLALLSGVRMASYDYVCFLNSGRSVLQHSWAMVPKKYYVPKKAKKHLLIGYTKMPASHAWFNTLVSLCYMHTQLFSHILLGWGVQFLANPLNVAFSKEQYLKDPNMLRQSKEEKHLASTLSHLNNTTFKAKTFWDKRLVVVENYGINLRYFLRSGVRVIRMIEHNIGASLFFLLYTLSGLVCVGSVVWLLCYPAMLTTCADLTSLLLALILLRFLCYWMSVIYLAKKVGEPTSTACFFPLFDILFCSLALPFGLIVWIFKSFKTR